MTFHKILATLPLITLLVATPTPSNPPARPAGMSLVPTSKVLHMVAAAVRITTLPKDLTPTLADAARDGGNILAKTQTGCDTDWQPVTVPACVWGDRTGSHTLVLLGDSHARMWLPAFNIIGERLHWKVVLLAKSSCPAPYTDFYNWMTHSAYPECDRWHSYAIARINHTNPDVVVVSGEDFLPRNGQKKLVTRDAWAAALYKTLHMITSSKTTKVILGPTPQLGKAHSPLCRRWSALQATRTTYRLVHHLGERCCRIYTAIPIEPSRQQADVQYIDVFPWLCSSVCTAVIGNMVVYGLRNHLTATYATYLSGALQAALQPAMTEHSSNCLRPFRVVTERRHARILFMAMLANDGRIVDCVRARTVIAPVIVTPHASHAPARGEAKNGRGAHDRGGGPCRAASSVVSRYSSNAALVR